MLRTVGFLFFEDIVKDPETLYAAEWLRLARAGGLRQNGVWWRCKA